MKILAGVLEDNSSYSFFGQNNKYVFGDVQVSSCDDAEGCETKANSGFEGFLLLIISLIENVEFILFL